MKTQYTLELVQGPQDPELDPAWLISSHADGKCQGKCFISLKTQTSILKAFQGVRYKEHGREGTEPGGKGRPRETWREAPPPPPPLQFPGKLFSQVESDCISIGIKSQQPWQPSQAPTRSRAGLANFPPYSLFLQVSGYLKKKKKKDKLN